METISWQDFEMVELRVGTLVRVEPFPEARKPAYKVWVDFGPELGAVSYTHLTLPTILLV